MLSTTEIIDAVEENAGEVLDHAVVVKETIDELTGLARSLSKRNILIAAVLVMTVVAIWKYVRSSDNSGTSTVGGSSHGPESLETKPRPATV